jgi:hypothetical protein
MRPQGELELWQEVMGVVDDIKLPKTLSSLSATHRIKKVNRRHTNMNQQRFGKQLKEEEDREKDNPEQADHFAESENSEHQDDGSINAERSMSRVEEEENEECKSQGKLVDVVV